MNVKVPIKWVMILFTLFQIWGCDTRIPVSDPIPLTVNVLQVATEQYSTRKTIIGEISAQRTVTHGFPISGKLIDVSVDAGDRVKKGDELARVDSILLQSDTDAAQANLSVAETQHTLAGSQLNRQRSLRKEGYIAQSTLESAEAALISSRETVSSAKAQLAIANDALDKAVLRAEDDGIITARYAESGQIIQAAQVVIELAVDGPRDAVFAVPEALFLHEISDDPIQLQLVDQPNIRANATVREISPSVSEQDGTVQIKAIVENATGLMPLGAAVEVSAMSQAIEAITLPWTALDLANDQPVVWVVDSNTQIASTKPVQIYSYELGKVIITGGLTPGDLVVTQGTKFLKSNETVRFLQDGQIR